MKRLQDLKVKIFGDGADKQSILDLYKNPLFKGFTTNPTLMRKAGIKDYEAFARDLAACVPDRSLSFEVFSDEFPEMERQAMKIRSWGENVYVKIPITNTKGASSLPLIHRLTGQGVKLNITAMTTMRQVCETGAALDGGAPAYVSVFAGRVADTGRDPIPEMAAAVACLQAYPNCELIWASARELLNIFQADDVGCQIITVPYDILKKLPLVGKDLNEYSLDTVKMFYEDASKSGFSL